MSTNPLALLAFGAIALLGLIVLAAVHSLTDAVQVPLVAIATGALGAAAGVTVQSHTHPAEPTTPPVNLSAGQ